MKHPFLTAMFSAAILLVLNTLSIAQTNTDTQATPAGHGTYAGARETVYPDWFKSSFLEFEEDIAEASAHNKRVLLLFHQDGCPYCNALVERNLSQKDIAELLQQRFDVIAINMWGDREIVSIGGDVYTEKTFSEALRVQFTPTLIFFNEQGKIILRLNGYLPPDEFRLALNYVAEKLETSHNYRDYIGQNKSAESGDMMNQQDFFSAPPYDLSASEQPIAVFFEQKHCPNCDVLHQQVLTEETTRELIKQFKVVQLDMWSETPLITPGQQQLTAREWAQQLKINYAPSIVLFNREGEEVIRSEAYFKVFHTQSLFDYVLNEGYKTQPNFQRYLSARADELMERGIDVDIWR